MYDLSSVPSAGEGRRSARWARALDLWCLAVTTQRHYGTSQAMKSPMPISSEWIWFRCSFWVDEWFTSDGWLSEAPPGRARSHCCNRWKPPGRGAFAQRREGFSRMFTTLKTLLLLANIVTTSKALVPRSDPLVPVCLERKCSPCAASYLGAVGLAGSSCHLVSGMGGVAWQKPCPTRVSVFRVRRCGHFVRVCAT